jgi:hypothetical protein
MAEVDPSNRDTWPAPHQGSNCQCRENPQPLKQLYVTDTAKANYGREFYVCPKQRNEQCKTFEWGTRYRATKPSAPPAPDRQDEIIALLYAIAAKVGVDAPKRAPSPQHGGAPPLKRSATGVSQSAHYVPQQPHWERKYNN